MKHALAELVDAILRRIDEHPEIPPTESGIRTWLTKEGYNKRDIEDAIRLIRPRFASAASMPPEGLAAARPLSPLEAGKLSPEARDALARLDMYGFIAPYEREMLLDRLNHFDGEIGLEELDYLLSWVVYGTRDFETQQALYQIVEGNGTTMH